MSLFLSNTAYAVDSDGDGYHQNGAYAADCNDFNATLNPNAVEVVGDGIDNDCDGLDGLRRRLLERQFPAVSWTRTGTVTGWGDGVQIGNAALGLSGSISKNYVLPIYVSKIHAVLAITNNTVWVPGTKCKLLVQTQQVPGPPLLNLAEWVISGAGTGALPTGALSVFDPARTLRNITISCEAGASISIDWFTLQNTDDVVPPAQEVEVTWEDQGMPGGGLASTVVRTGDGLQLWAGSDVGGIAMKNPWIPGSNWRWRSGDPTLGALVSQPDLSVWDILPTSWDEVFILTGRANGNSVRGGLFSSIDDGASWQPLVDSDPTPDSNDASEVTVGGYGRFTGCGGNNEWAGGALLVEESFAEGVYIANHDLEDLGLAYWDGTEACMLATSDLPAAYIGALARVTSYPSELPALLVGYRGIGGSSDALFLCSLPQNTAGAVDFDCADTSGVTCVPMPEGAGIDVRDFEVDTVLESIVYVADGGNDPTAGSDEACEAGTGGLYGFEITDDSFGSLDWTWDGILSTGMDITSDIELTGVSMDPDGDFLYAFAPVTPGKAYSYDRIYRIPYASIGTAGWVAINQDAADEADRAAAMDLSGAWLDDTTATVVRPRLSSAGTTGPWAPGFAIDAVWFTDSSTPTADGCGGFEWSAALITGFNSWRADGLDGGCNGAAWDPEDDTIWTFWPEPEESHEEVWQTTAVHDVAYDINGNTWSMVGDLGMFQLPAGETAGEVDCLWDAFGGGGGKVRTTHDGAVWMTLYDQDYNSKTIPHNIGVFRTLDSGLTWEYEGASVPTNSEFAYNEDIVGTDRYYDRLSCIDGDDGHVATAFGDAEDIDAGNTFRESGALGENDAEIPSWGLPLALDALDANTAIVGFRGYEASDFSVSQTGRVAYTLNGGDDWADVAFNAGTYGCDEKEFSDGYNGIAILQPDVRSYNDSSGWRLEFFVSSDYASGTTEDYKHCALAKVVVEPDSSGAAVATWIWYTLDSDDGTTICAVDGRNLNGVSTSLWGEEAFVWGEYSYVKSSGKRRGGVCVVDIDDPATRSTLVSPDEWQVSIRAVAAHPWVSDMLAIAPILNAETWFACHQDGDGDCPDAPRVLLSERGNAGWSTWQVATMPPSLAGNGLAWTDLDESGLIYGSAGSGS